MPPNLVVCTNPALILASTTMSSCCCRMKQIKQRTRKKYNFLKPNFLGIHANILFVSLVFVYPILHSPHTPSPALVFSPPSKPHIKAPPITTKPLTCSFSQNRAPPSLLFKLQHPVPILSFVSFNYAPLPPISHNRHTS